MWAFPLPSSNNSHSEILYPAPICMLRFCEPWNCTGFVHFVCTLMGVTLKPKRNKTSIWNISKEEDESLPCTVVLLCPWDKISLSHSLTLCPIHFPISLQNLTLSVASGNMVYMFPLELIILLSLMFFLSFIWIW